MGTRFWPLSQRQECSGFAVDQLNASKTRYFRQVRQKVFTAQRPAGQAPHLLRAFDVNTETLEIAAIFRLSNGGYDEHTRIGE